MNREELKAYILETYNVQSDFPWSSYPENEVFRHTDNKKWFALLMSIPREKLRLEGTEKIDVVNLKCDPFLIGSLRTKEGFYPAYHMNKEQWITVVLSDEVEEELKMLLDMSYEATARKSKKNKS